jgi:hypothetical protein
MVAGSLGEPLIPTIKFTGIKASCNFRNHQCRGRFMMAVALLRAIGIAGGFALSRLDAEYSPDHADVAYHWGLMADAGKTLTRIA